MRIATNTILSSNLTNLTLAQNRLLAAQELVSTGKTLNQPSDNPAGLSQDVSIRTTLDNLTQYQRNLDDANGFVGLTDTALTQLTQQLRSARDIALRGANDSIDLGTRAELGDQVHQISVEVAQIANATYGSRYLFGGQRTTQPPFVPDNAGSYAYTGGSLSTSDDNLTVTIGDSETMVINVAGDRIFNEPFQALANLQADLTNGQVQSISTADIDAIDAALKTVTTVHAEFGANAQRLQQASERITQKQSNLRNVLSQIEDADLPKAIMELQTSQMSYQASLTSVARTFQNSLLDFLH
jgi:flagellar hook-associated protein 3 FlgL